MAGAQKKRAQKERKEKEVPENGSSSNKESSSGSPSSDSPTSGSPPGRFDGNRDPTRTPAAPRQPGNAGQVAPILTTGSSILNRNLDIAEMYMAGQGYGQKLPQRPNRFNNTGQEVDIKLNTFNVTQFPQKPVYQYDVVVGTGDERRGKIRKVLATDQLLSQLDDRYTIFDGNKLAWSMKKFERDVTRITVDLDKAQGRKPREGKPADTVVVELKYTKTLNFAPLNAFIANQTDFDVNCLEAINFLDHLLRQSPSNNLIPIRRSFFFREGRNRIDLGKGVEALKGIYQSVRFGHMGRNTPAYLSINVDVSNCAFYKESALTQIAMEMLLTGRAQMNLNTLSDGLNAGGQQPEFKQREVERLWKLKRLDVYSLHLAQEQAKKDKKKLSNQELAAVAKKQNVYRIEKFLNESAQSYELKGIKVKEDSRPKDMSLQQYFLEKYGVRLQYPKLPVVQTNRKIRTASGQSPIVLPMELLYLMPDQRYIQKLEPAQTSAMIKFAVEFPGKRWQAIELGLSKLNWGGDQFLNKYGMNISPNPAEVKARLLPPPTVNFIGKVEKPMYRGKWMLKDATFAKSGTALQSWGVVHVPGNGANLNMGQIKAWWNSMKGVWVKHGIKVPGNPVYFTPQPGQQPDAWLGEFWSAIKRGSGIPPQMMCFIFNFKDTALYRRIKKNCDKRFGIVSQVVLQDHVVKGFHPQYASNIAAKVNAKLGGFTARAQSTATKPDLKNKTYVRPGYCFIGADVTHGAPASAVTRAESKASIAAITMSADVECIKYWAEVATNGIKVEMVQAQNIDKILTKLGKQWIKNQQNRAPSDIFYIRDGVSESQYAQVLNQELTEIRKVFTKLAPNYKPRYNVIVGTKRHHVRFFPKDSKGGDNNGNPNPGTLIEVGVTHPREYDFYLCAHSAIKGTARPVHYQMLHNETKLENEDLQNMLYEASYQYVKSSTPISLFPAAYYAHLAAERGRAHENTKSVTEQETIREGAGSDAGSSDVVLNTYDLIPWPAENNCEFNMWWC